MGSTEHLAIFFLKNSAATGIGPWFKHRHQADPRMAQAQAAQGFAHGRGMMGIVYKHGDPRDAAAIAGRSGWTRARALQLLEKGGHEVGEPLPLDPEALRGRLDERTGKIVAEVENVSKEIGCSMAQVALAWLLSKPGVSSVILGARTTDQLEDNLGCLDVALDEDQMKRLDSVSAITLGYPHDFVASENVQNYIFGGVEVERR